MRVGRGLIAGLVLAVVGLSGGVASASTLTSAQRPDRTLSNETTFTTWTVADRDVAITVIPSPHAAAITSLHAQTPDGFLQSYVLLRERWIGGRAWVLLRIPMRPNGRVGWVPRSALDTFQRVHTELVVDRERTALTLYSKGRAIFHAPVGTGQPRMPTPGGHFWITEAFRSYNPFYGPYAFATSDYSTLTDWPGGGIVGLHGTNEPGLIPGHPSHGCIRLRNPDILTLSRLVPIGTPLLVK